ncbi:hypothetical protein ASC64_04360 [Nocardioides sp. Root122]|uniref:SMP-30/gluconolactonase/LRE family protein n=1 Tax=Nocardioides TaxID=1839 RepID=UPI000702C025|nr:MULTISPECIES: SMP-30/gluconolactonase/LRE family protein [Nocardioides]KQV71282.1 hypothetical protein ASC64_04360 [Nocardioides sp. Root122]MCK9822766.1 SMP-30/gluconolactonase/LRE family protein [Nocardioides cavernae]
MTVQPVDMPVVELGEGARWWASGPVQVDLLAGRLLSVGPQGIAEVLALDVPLGAAAPRTGGGLALVAGTSVHLLDDGADAPTVVIDTGLDPRSMRVNDACTDEAGRLWFGLMAYDATPGSGSLWRLEPDHSLARVLDGITIPNGPVIDHRRGVLYLADSARGLVLRGTIDVATGELGVLETFAHVPDASPDGMALDDEGLLWSALWGGSRLHCYDLDGSLASVVPLPASQPTSIAFDPTGGPALVTTARHGLAHPGDLDGRSFWVDLGRSARPALPYGG